MERWLGKVALVTGASAGIGEAIARSLVQHGMKVLGVSRSPDKIRAVASTLTEAPGKLISMKCDVRNEAEVKEIFEFAKKELGGVDVVINNAGLAHNAPLLDPTSATADWKEMLDTNVLAVCLINREFMKQMKEREIDDGHIIIMSGMAGHRVMNCPRLHFYSATKFAVAGLADAIRFELRNMKSNIRVSVISPGTVRTEFIEKSKNIDHKSAMEFYDTAFYNNVVIESEDIARSVVFILSMPQRAEVNDIIIRSTGQPS